jgi:hypothetical protein
LVSVSGVSLIGVLLDSGILIWGKTDRMRVTVIRIYHGGLDDSCQGFVYDFSGQFLDRPCNSFNHQRKVSTFSACIAENAMVLSDKPVVEQVCQSEKM